MRYVFLGTTEFSAALLACLSQSGARPALVVCNPDRPVGRKQIMTPPPAKVMAEAYGIPVFQPEQLDRNAEAELTRVNADFFVLADYGKILPLSFLRISPRGIIGVHVSLLPKYRGPSPMQTAILEGAEETGVTLYLLDEKVDHGPILAQTKFALDTRTFLELRAKGAARACDLLKKILPEFAAGRISPRPQDEMGATYTRKFKGEDAFVEEHDLKEAQDGAHPECAQQILRKIRALNPEPGVWTTQNGTRVKLLEAIIENGALRLNKIQMEGKKPRSI